MPCSSPDISHLTLCMVIQTDASTLGWGAVYGNQEVAGGGGGGEETDNS